MKRGAKYRPMIGITMGDAAGVGPEIIVKTLMAKGIYSRCRPVIIGDGGIMERAVAIVKATATVRRIGDVGEAHFVYGTLDVLDLKNLPLDLPFARVDARAGRAAYEYVERAVNLAMQRGTGRHRHGPPQQGGLGAGRLLPARAHGDLEHPVRN